MTSMTDGMAAFLRALRYRWLLCAPLKRTDIVNRSIRRRVIEKVGGFANYVRLLCLNPSGLVARHGEFLFHASAFFRDPEVFEVLRYRILPRILAGSRAGKVVRIWVPACSTGEEVYSISILLAEILGDRTDQPRIQLIGTDISDDVIEQARTAVYREPTLGSVSPERLLRFFTRTEGGYQVSCSVQRICEFHRHDIAHDPPFPDLDLISCRNWLSYFMDPAGQKRVLAVFHSVLRPEGYLVLGKTEFINVPSSLFEKSAGRNMIFLRKDVETPPVNSAPPRGPCARSAR